MLWMASNIKLIAISLLLASMVGLYFIGYYRGGNACEVRHKVDQLEHEIEVRERHEEIDRKTPYSADRAAKFKWLRDNAGK